MEYTKLKKKALQKPETAKPPIKLPTKYMIMALMTSKKRPSVSTVMGSVSMISIGFKKALKRLITSATITAVPKLLTEMP